MHVDFLNDWTVNKAELSLSELMTMSSDKVIK